jgi:hypothetical protein
MARKPKTFIRDMKCAAEKLAKLRDELRAIEDEAKELADISDDARDSLIYAVDRLSEQV